MASSGLKKMLIFIISQHWRCHNVGVSCNFFWTFDGFSGRCYNHQADVLPVVLADVLPIGFCMWQMLLPSFLWQMLLPLLCLVLADVVAIFIVGWCYCHCLFIGRFCGRCYCHCGCWYCQFCRIDVPYCGRCYCHHWLGDVIAIVYVLLYCVADVAATMADSNAIL